MKKCPKTLSGKHVWDDDIAVDTGELKETIETPPKWTGQTNTYVSMKPIYKYYHKCSACGLIDDRKPFL